jgi:conjugal transfer pilus assembly protein TrbC
VAAFAGNAALPAIDIASLSEQYQSVNESVSMPSTSKLLVFVSFSMPEDSLKALQREVGEVGGDLIIRGLIDNSLKKTAGAVSGVLDNGKGGLSIDPTSFQQYHIRQVPAFVVTNGQDEDNYDVVYGNVSLEAALTELANKGDSAKDSAQQYLDQLHARTQV